MSTDHSELLNVLGDETFVTELLGNREPLLEDCQLGLQVRVRVGPDSLADEVEARTRGEPDVALRGCALDHVLEDRADLPFPPELVDRVSVDAQETRVLAILLRHEGDRSLGQVRRGAVVRTLEGSLAPRAEMAGGARRERRVRISELGAVSVRLLEVIAEDLVVLADAIAGALLEPVGVALVQRRAELLGRGAVGGVADEDVLEAVRDHLAGEAGGREPDHVLAGELGRASALRRVLAGELVDGALVEELALDRAALERVPLPGLEPVEPGAEERIEAGGKLVDVAALAHPGDELLGVERVAGGRVREPDPGLRRGLEALEQRVDLGGTERLEPHRDGPVGPVLEQLGPGEAEQEDGAPRSAAGSCSSRSSSAGSAQWMSSISTHERLRRPRPRRGTPRSPRRSARA